MSGQAFRALLAGEALIHPASVFDPLSARLAVDLGYEAGILGGSVASAVVLGAPDLIVLTLPELAETVRRIARAAPGWPLLVDADHGFGNALSVTRTVEELEAAGAAALTIEDTWLPQPYGETATRLVSVEEGAGKIRAALAARRRPDLVVVARTGALSVTGEADAAARVRAYAVAGAEAIFLTGLSDAAQLAPLRAAAGGLPLLLGGTRGTPDPSALRAGGVRVALQGHHVHTAALQAMHAALKALREGTPPGRLEGQPDRALVARALREEEWARRGREHLGG